jgi:p70 ribosomal S6 kinase/serum/glucocorticoid-regulated kinase 1/serum/glucocorticoid-regulated kinase 2
MINILIYLIDFIMGICLQKEKENVVEDSAGETASTLANAEQIKLNDQLKMVCLEDFNYIKIVGRGSFGKVMLV